MLLSQECKTCGKQTNNYKYCSRKCINFKGENNPAWKNGQSYVGKYIIIKVVNHPHANNGYVYAHRLVMEGHIGRYLTSEEIVHHIDGNTHNNLIDNLELTNRSIHISRHMMGNKYRLGKEPSNKRINNESSEVSVFN